MIAARRIHANAGVIVIAALACWGCGRSKPPGPPAPPAKEAPGSASVVPSSPPAEIAVKRVAWGSDPSDPGAAFWKDVPEALVPVLPQAIAQPMHLSPAVSVLGVRAVHDGETLAVRLEWEDPTQSYVLASDQFGDEVAIQFPLAPAAGQAPSPMMGHAGAPVRIFQWRSTLQWELQNGMPTIQALYPNAVVDFYPGSLLAGQVAASYSTGRAVGNPVAQPRLLSPVVTQVAEGWGSLTDAPAQVGGGRGIWKEGRWHVTITQPLAQGESATDGLHPGMTTVIGFAVWDGGKDEVGSRKGWASWVPLRIGA